MFGLRAWAASNTPGCMVAPTSKSLLISREAAVSALPGWRKTTRNGLGSGWKPVWAPQYLSLRSNGADWPALGEVEVVEGRRVFALPDVLGQDRQVDLRVLDEIEVEEADVGLVQ